MNRLLFAAALLLSSLAAWAQGLNDEEATRSFKQAEQAITVLANEGGLLPLQRLDTLRIAYIGFGQLRTGPFLEHLQHYMPITQLQAPMAMDELWLSEQRSRFNLFIIELEDIAQGGQMPAAYLQAETIRSLLSELPCVLFINGDGTAFQVMPWLQKAEGLLIAPPQVGMGPVVAAQIIFGAVGAKGQLRGRIPGTAWPTGHGFTYPANGRLRYTPFGYAGMNETLLRDSIAAIVEEGLKYGAYPGAQVLVARNGNVVYQQAFGYHTADSARAVAVDDLYDLASVSKIASALPALMRLHGQGQFELDAPLKRYHPKFRFSKKGKLPFRPMLAHHAQLRPWVPYWQTALRGHSRYPWQDGWDKARLNDRDFRRATFAADSSRRFSTYVTDSLWLHRNYKKKIYRAISKSPFNEEPGYVYSGLLFYLLPDIVERISGQGYEDYLNEQLYHRIGAYTLGYNPLRHFPLQRIVPTERDTFFRMQLIHGRVHDEGAAMMGGVSANAGLFANANDLAKLMQLFLNEGQYGGEQLIAPGSVAEFTRCQYCEEGNRRGLGFDKPLIEYDAKQSYISQAASPRSFGHGGYTGTLTWADPENGLLLVFLSNRVYPTRENRKLYELNIRPRLHSAVYEGLLD